MKRKLWPLDSRTISNLIVVVVGILFYFILAHYNGVRSRLSALINVFSPFIAGFAIAYLLNTPTKYFERTVYQKVKYRRALSIVTVYLLVAVILGILLNLVLPQAGSSAMELVGKMPDYLSQLNVVIQNLMARFDVQEAEGITDLVGSYQDLVKRLASIVTTALPHLFNMGMAIGSGVLTALTALITSIYMLSGKDRLVPQLKKLIYAMLPTSGANWFLRVCSQANGTFVGFINGKLLDSAIIGVLCFILNAVLRIPYSLLIAVIIGVTNIIPFFGPIIGAVPCLLILLLIDPWAGLRFGILVLVLQQFDGNILGPKILGNSTGLSAIWVLVAIVVGGRLFGFAGMLLGVPTFAVLYALVREWANHQLAIKGIDSNGHPIKESSASQQK